ncbi:MAG: T9SS type A sorting domain-containing protein [Paludibacter sp.]|jgi:hypothetical protein
MLKKLNILTFLFFFFCAVLAVERPKAPLYWSVYEYCYEASGNQMNGGAIPENVWKANIDWVAENLQPYGYNIICIDGWGDDSSFNENGYRTKHASGKGESGSVNWEHDYAWWSQYIQSKGMTLGMYNNPLWVNRKAAHCRIKGREDLTVGSLIDENENATWFTWVQVDRPGAEEYVKNYVRYYADMGVKYMRVDFLSWFEDGIDKMPSLSSYIQRPKEHYRTALRWMKEVCDENDMILSLVMPHLYNDAENEIISAPNSLIRINEDVCDGGWYRLSEIERGKSHSIWSQYHNMFDGFVYWSRISDNMILDGDFTRLNTFENDAEKMTAISLQLMAGGPIAVADQYNTIGDNLHFYINNEILQLNKDGFIGKPLSNNPLEKNSQIWKGQLSNGDWIVGLFNRENTTELRSIDLKKELGFEQGEVRNLWEYKNLGIKNSLSDFIEPHGCRIYRVRKTSTALTDKHTCNDIQFLASSDGQIKIIGVNTGLLNIFNIQGEIVTTMKIADDPSIFSFNTKNQGVYIANLRNKKQEITKKIIVK